MQIQHHTFLVTGGGSGLGAATATHLVRLGANVVLADLNAAAGTAHAATLGDRAVFVPADVTSEDQVQHAIAEAVTRFGALHGVVNAAGILIGRRVLGKQGPHDLDGFARVLHVNVVGTFNVVRLAGAVMAQNPPEPSGERGVIINTASIAAFDGQIGQAAYAASKAAVAGMALPIAREFARFGIRVNTIAPGVFETPMVGGMTEEVKASLSAQVPFPARLGRPAEYAHLVQHLLENEYLNAEVIRLDGAIRMAAQ
jgi:NAD(P)-dependent dehydrogenase (short-subunit alcohol dehydrogenase family)